MRNIIKPFLIIALTMGCSSEKKSNEINLYSQRHYEVDKKQYENFEKLTGIKINVVKANADELIERLKNEGKNSPADLFISVDAGKLQRAKKLGLLQKINSKKVNQNVEKSLIDKSNFSQLKAEDLMNKNPLTALDTDNLQMAENRMREAKVQCLIVKNQINEVVGVIQIFE